MNSQRKTLDERLDFRCSQDAASELRRIARDEETTIGAIIRRAVRRLLEEERAAGDAQGHRPSRPTPTPR